MQEAADTYHILWDMLCAFREDGGQAAHVKG